MNKWIVKSLIYIYKHKLKYIFTYFYGAIPVRIQEIRKQGAIYCNGQKLMKPWTIDTYMWKYKKKLGKSRNQSGICLNF